MDAMLVRRLLEGGRLTDGAKGWAPREKPMTKSVFLPAQQTTPAVLKHASHLLASAAASDEKSDMALVASYARCIYGGATLLRPRAQRCGLAAATRKWALMVSAVEPLGGSPWSSPHASGR